MQYHSFDPSHALFLAPFFMIVGAVGVILALIPYWFIFKKAGFSPWITVLMIIPLVNLIVLYVVAFSQWKVVPQPYAYPAMPPGSGYPPVA